MKQFDDIDANRIIYKDFNSPEELILQILSLWGTSGMM